MSGYSRRLYNERWWRALRWYVINDRAGGVCEQCNFEFATQVHHLVYPSGRREQASDLLALCDDCHHAMHFPVFVADNDNQPALDLTGTE